MTPRQYALRARFGCPSCGVLKGQACRTYAGGRPTTDHPARVAVFEAFEEGVRVGAASTRELEKSEGKKVEENR